MWNAGLDEAQAGIKIAWRNINNLRYADDSRKWRNTEEPLDESERGEWKSWPKSQHSENEDHDIRFYHFMSKRWGNSERFYFGGAPQSLQMVTTAMKLKDLAPWKKSYDQPRQHIKKQRHHFTNNGPSSQSYGFPNSHVWMWELDFKESWVLKIWCFWIVVLEKTLESPLDCKEVQPIHPKGDQPWDFFERNDAKAETPVLWPPHAKSWLIGKDSDAGRDWGQ